MGLFGSDPPKAQILCLEASGFDVVAQFNPNELSYKRKLKWDPGGGSKGKDCNSGLYSSAWGVVQYTGANTDSLSVTLLFDEGEKRDEGLMNFVPQFGLPAPVAGKLAGSTLGKKLLNETSVLNRDGKNGDVRRLHKLTLPMIKDASNDDVLRPPVCAFIWGDFQFQGVIESLDVSFKLFDANGSPRRAECKIEMKGRALTQAKNIDEFMSGQDSKLSGKASAYKTGTVSGTKAGKLVDALGN